MLISKDAWRGVFVEALGQLASQKEVEVDIQPKDIVIEIPPKAELGDLAFPLFPFSRHFRTSPVELAKTLLPLLENMPEAKALGKAELAGPYINVRLNRAAFAERILTEGVANPENLKGSRIMLEFSSPNTNKPLHLGHLRNDALGESMSRILKACGAEVYKVSIINDRGIHICKSMLAYQKFFQGKSPESEGLKGDRFVGDCYVRYNEYAKENPKAEGEAQELLRLWEAGAPETLKLWKKMNGWAVEGMQATYRRTDVSFDHYYYESETYLKGKEIVLKGLEDGLFFRAEDGSIQVDLENEGLDTKVLLRKDGTSIYITQDIGTAISRHSDWPFERLIYVVGSEQDYHFKVLFSVLKKLGYKWAEKLYHLSYGMVNLPEGRMKSREGTVVDADDLLDNLRDLALEEIREKEREGALEDPLKTAEAVALGAVHYYLLQVSAPKDMIFNPKESLSFTGNTGPYLQYMLARIHSLLRKAEAEGYTASADFSEAGALLDGDAEWALLRAMASYPEVLMQSAERMDPSLLTTWLYELSKVFSRFYHDIPILGAKKEEEKFARLALVGQLRLIMEEALTLACIPAIKEM